MARMHLRRWPILAILSILVGQAGAQDITIYRCTDGQGRVTLQDAPCAAGESQQRRSMVQPQAPAPRVPAPPTAEPAPAPQVVDAPPPPRPPPPPMYQCTTYDGETRYSEKDDPNPRCVPLAVLGYDVGAYGAACRWVEDSCLRLDDASACDQFQRELRQAKSDALHAFSDTAAYRDSEVKRLTQIVRASC